MSAPCPQTPNPHQQDLSRQVRVESTAECLPGCSMRPVSSAQHDPAGACLRHTIKTQPADRDELLSPGFPSRHQGPQHPPRQERCAPRLLNVTWGLGISCLQELPRWPTSASPVCTPQSKGQHMTASWDVTDVTDVTEVSAGAQHKVQQALIPLPSTSWSGGSVHLFSESTCSEGQWHRWLCMSRARLAHCAVS